MIQRDGAATSLWQSTTSPIQTSGQFANQEFDVIIVGGGITGLTTALLLQKAGKHCVLIEAITLCFGTTGGTTAHLNTLLDTPYPKMIRDFGSEGARLVANNAKAAIELIEKNIQEFQIDCDFQRASAYLMAADNDQEKELESIVEASRQLGVACEFVTKIPWPFSVKKAAEFSGQGKFHPTRYAMGLAKAFQEFGGMIVENCRVRNAEYKEVILIESPKGKIYAHHLIYATHIPPGVTQMNLRCAPYRSYAIALQVEGEYPESLAYDMQDPYHYFRIQHIDDQKFLIAGGEDHKTGHPTLTENPFASLEELVARDFKIKTVTNRWSSQFFESVDGLPFIGRLGSSKAKIYAATGYGGNGMIYGTVAASILHDIIEGIDNPCIKLFSPERHKPIAAAKSFIKENADVASKFISKFWPAHEFKSSHMLAPERGDIFKMDGSTLAIYKDGAENLYAVDPTCTHMKCQVKWNEYEKSWDCPCHGARYSIEGEVLTGPADYNLTKMEAAPFPKVKSENH